MTAMRAFSSEALAGIVRLVCSSGAPKARRRGFASHWVLAVDFGTRSTVSRRLHSAAFFEGA
jgi:hypothetical protein